MGFIGRDSFLTESQLFSFFLNDVLWYFQDCDVSDLSCRLVYVIVNVCVMYGPHTNRNYTAKSVLSLIHEDLCTTIPHALLIGLEIVLYDIFLAQSEFYIWRAAKKNFSQKNSIRLHTNQSESRAFPVGCTGRPKKCTLLHSFAKSPSWRKISRFLVLCNYAIQSKDEKRCCPKTNSDPCRLSSDEPYNVYKGPSKASVPKAKHHNWHVNHD